MNLAFVRYFVAVVETAGFTTAAERCHVTQPTLSAGIARLEAEVGARLFERGRRTALTLAGQRFLPHARTMLESWQTARAEQRSARQLKLIRISLAPTLPMQAAMQWIATAQRRLGFDVEISDGKGRCDLALSAVRGPAPTARAVTLFREPYVLACSDAHLIATRDRWSVNDLGDTSFVLRAACEAHEEAQRLFAAEGVRPRAVLRSTDEERCAGAVLAGLGVCLMPRSLLRAGMASAEIREVMLERRVVLAWQATTDPETVAALREAAHPGGEQRLDFAR